MNGEKPSSNGSFIFEEDGTSGNQSTYGGDQSVGSLTDLLNLVNDHSPSAPPGSIREPRELDSENELLHPAEPLPSERPLDLRFLRKVRLFWFAVGFHVLAIPLIVFSIVFVFRRRAWHARLPLAVGVGCRQDTECLSGTCALSNSTSSKSSLICCPVKGGDANGYDDSGSLVRVCTNMPVGTSCGSIDAICDGFCIDGFCLPSTLRTSERCDRGNDCEYGSCAHGEAYLGAPTVCCAKEGSLLTKVPMSKESDDTGSRVSVNVCKSLPIGAFCSGQGSVCATGLCIDGACAPTTLPDFEPCSQNSHCRNGVCGLTNRGDKNETICCPNGASTIIAGSDVSEQTCASMPIRTKCYGTDAICESRICINGLCAVQLLQNDKICEESSDCESGICALSSAGVAAPKICCKSGEIFGAVDGVYNAFCDDRPASTLCGGLHSICSMGLACLNGVCSSLLPDNGQCSDSSSCSSKACGRGAAKSDAPTICCASGRLTQGIIEIAGKEKSVDLCAGQPSGTVCAGVETMCQEGLSCVNGVCGEPLGPQEVCAKSTDCSNNACALASPVEFFPTVCCASGKTTNVYVDTRGLTKTYSAVCADQPAGSLCGSTDAVCATGLRCIENVCGELKKTGAPCTASTDCKSNKCVFKNPNITSIKVCCEASETSFMDFFDSSGTTKTDYGEVCVNPKLNSTTPEGSLSPVAELDETPVPVEVRTISLRYFGLDDSGIQTTDVDEASNLTCGLMVGHLRSQFNAAVHHSACGVISNEWGPESGPVLSYSMLVSVGPSSLVTETEIYSTLASFIADQQDDIIDALSKLPASNKFGNVTRVFMKLGVV